MSVGPVVPAPRELAIGEPVVRAGRCAWAPGRREVVEAILPGVPWCDGTGPAAHGASDAGCASGAGGLSDAGADVSGDALLAIEVRPDLGRPEAYEIDAGAVIRITAGGEPGVVWALQTLRQLMWTDPTASPVDALRALPALRVRDEPRFGWRGALLDVARWFRPVADVERFIDWASLHRLNVVQLHLTDDQGWRFESTRHPRLTEVGAWRTHSPRGPDDEGEGDGTPHGGFYTQAELRALVAYAALRGVTLVPEIDAPGHMQAAIAAYPALGGTAPVPVSTRWGVMEHVLNVEDATVRFVCDVLDEVMEIFPSGFVHIGGDECPKEEWRRSARARRLMRERGLATEEELQSWFVGRLAAHVTAAGRRAIGWGEILEGGLAPGATVMSWRDVHAGVAAARAGHDVVFAPDTHLYFNHRDADADKAPAPPFVITWEKAYGFDPIPAPLRGTAAAARVLGLQCALWGEYLPDAASLAARALPRLAAFAEVAWGTTGSVEALRPRLAAHTERLARTGLPVRMR